MRIEENYSLEKHNTFHLPVKTRWFMEYTNEEELERVLRDEFSGVFVAAYRQRKQSAVYK